MVNGGGHFDMLVGSGAWAGRPRSCSLCMFFVRVAARGIRGILILLMEEEKVFHSNKISKKWT